MRNETKGNGKNETIGTAKKPGLEKLKAQREKLDARIQKMEALGKVQERKQDLRRKILIGAYYLGQAIKEGTVPELRETMNGFLTRDCFGILRVRFQPF